MNKESASKEMAGYQQTRKGKRPIRVHNLLKKAGPVSAIVSAGKPAASATKDAIKSLPGAQAAAKKLSQSTAEVGPVIKKGSVEFNMIENDPLIQYLKKTAAEAPPTKGLVDSEGILEDNKDDMPRGQEEKEMSSMNPGPTPAMEQTVRSPWKTYLEMTFDNKDGIKKKYTDKDHRPDEGSDVVKKALGL